MKRFLILFVIFTVSFIFCWVMTHYSESYALNVFYHAHKISARKFYELNDILNLGSWVALLTSIIIVIWWTKPPEEYNPWDHLHDRVRYVLEDAHYYSLADVVANYSEERFLRIPGLGVKGIYHIEDWLIHHNISIYEDEPEQEQKQEQSQLNVAQAFEMLGLTETASNSDIHAAYHRLMKRIHPDVGGTDYFAKQLNEAKAVLLG